MRYLYFRAVKKTRWTRRDEHMFFPILVLFSCLGHVHQKPTEEKPQYLQRFEEG